MTRVDSRVNIGGIGSARVTLDRPQLPGTHGVSRSRASCPSKRLNPSTANRQRKLSIGAEFRRLSPLARRTHTAGTGHFRPMESTAPMILLTCFAVFVPVEHWPMSNTMAWWLLAELTTEAVAIMTLVGCGMLNTWRHRR